MAVYELGIRLVADGRGLVGEVRTANGVLKQFHTDAEQGAVRSTAAMGRTRQGVQSISDQLGAARRQLIAFFSAHVGFQTLGQLREVADGYTNILSRLNLVSNGTRELARAEDELFASSQRTSTQLGTSVNLYARLVQSTQEYGISQSRVLALTESINQTFAVSGATADAQANAVTQFTQALAGGVMRAEEFNSVIEQAPRLAQALADGLGIGMGELRRQVNDGEVTVQRIVSALEDQADVIAEEFGGMALTIERAWTQVGNAFTRYIGQADQVSGVSARIAGALQFVAQNLDMVVTTGELVIGFFAVRLVAALATSMSASIAATMAAAALARAELEAARAAEVAAAADLAKARTRSLVGASTVSVTAAETAYAAAQARTVSAQAAVLTMWGRLGQSVVGFGRTLLGLAGGPIGAVLLAVGGLVYGLREWNNANDDLLITQRRVTEVLQQLETSTDATREASIQAARAARDEAQGRLEVARAALAEAEAKTQAALATGISASKAGQEYQAAEFAALAARVEKARSNYAGIRAEIERLDAALVVADGTSEKWRATGERLADAVGGRWLSSLLGLRQEKERTTKATKDLTTSDDESEKATRRAEAAKRAYAQALESARRAADELTKIYRALTAQLGGPGVRVTQQYEDTVAALADAWNELVAIGPPLIAQIEAYDQAMSNAVRVRDTGLAQLELERDYLSAISEAVNERVSAIGRSTQALEAERIVTDALNRARDAGADITTVNTAALIAQTTATLEAAAAAERWAQFWLQNVDAVAGALGDFMTGQIQSFEDFGETLVSIIRRAVSDMIAEFARLAAIKVMTGQGGSWSDIAMQAMGGGGSGGGFNLGSLLGMGSTAGTAAMGAGTYGVLASQGVSAMTGTYGVVAGTGYGGGAAPWLTGAVTAGTGGTAAIGAGGGAGAGAAGTAAMAAVAVVAAIAVLAYMGYQMGAKWFDQGWDPNNDLNRDAMSTSSLLQQPGGYFAAGTMWGNDMLRSLGMSDRSAAIWSGAAGMTRMFGYRNPEVWDRGMNFQFGEDGASGERWQDVIAQGGWFRSDRWWRETEELTAEVQRSLDRFWRGITEAVRSGARMLGTSQEDVRVIGASFWSEYDADGELVDALGTIFGLEYEEAWEQFADRIRGFNILSVIASALTLDQIGVPREIATGTGRPEGETPAPPGSGRERDNWIDRLSKVAEAIDAGGDGVDAAVEGWDERMRALLDIALRWDSTGELFLEGAMFLLQAASDMVNGIGLLGADGTLAEIADLVEEYQNSSESLLETYNRLFVATEYLQRAVDLAGTTLDLAREEFVRLAADITEAAGGLDAATALWDGFFTSFYGETERLMLDLDSLLSRRDTALEGIGLDPGVSMAEFREAFEAGMADMTAEQIVQWLEAARVLAAATDAQQRYALALVDTSTTLETIMAGVDQGLAQLRPQASSYGEAIANLRARNEALIQRTRDLGATEEQLAAVREFAERRLAILIEQLRATVEGLAAELYGTPLSQIEDEIRRLEAQSQSAASGLGGVSSAVSDLYEAHRRGVQGVRDYLDRMLLGDLSGLSPEEQLAEARRQLTETAAAAEGGDADAINRLPQLAEAYLRMRRDFDGSGDDYNQEWQWVRDLLAPVAAQTFPEAPGPGGVGGGGTYEVTASAELQALYEQRDAMMAEREAAHRLALAQQLAVHLGELAEATGRPVLELAASMGVTMMGLAEDLGINLESITGSTVQQLAAMSGMLGLSLTDLTSALGLELTDLAGGVTELTEQLGIDLSALTTESTVALAGLARDLGVDLGELATSVGADLGELADSQSLLNDALESTINGLPSAQANQLRDMLNAIENATTEADARAAVQAAEDAINDMPAEIRNQLAPYFQGVFPAQAVTEIGYLSSIDQNAYDTATYTRESRDYLRDIASRPGNTSGVASFDVGSSYVPYDMLANIHQGEKIIDPVSSGILQRYGIRVHGVASDTPIQSAILRELQRLSALVDQADRNNQSGQERIAMTVGAEHEEDRSQRDELARRASDDMSRSGRYG